MDLPSPHPRRRPSPDEVLTSKNEIKNLENNINIIERRIMNLQEELQNLRRKKENHESFIAPLKRLPAELVGAIIETCIHDEISINTLSQICGSVRDIVVGMPSIWSHIRIVPRYRPFFRYERRQWVGPFFFSKSNPLIDIE
jgi:hypothetical protein